MEHATVTPMSGLLHNLLAEASHGIVDKVIKEVRQDRIDCRLRGDAISQLWCLWLEDWHISRCPITIIRTLKPLAVRSLFPRRISLHLISGPAKVLVRFQ